MAIRFAAMSGVFFPSVEAKTTVVSGQSSLKVSEMLNASWARNLATSLDKWKWPIKLCDRIALRPTFSGGLTNQFYNGSMCAIPSNTLFNIYKVLGFNEERA